MNKKLKLLRNDKNLSQKEVTNIIGVTVSAYSNYEQEIREPSYDILIKLAKFYGVSTDYLLGLED